MNKLKVLLGVLVVLVLLTAPAYFENGESEVTRGTLAGDARDGGDARGAFAAASYIGGGQVS